MKRPLFVFAGQSNMMGAATLEASEQVYYKRSLEYLHKPRRFGAAHGDFKSYGFPVGEFSYIDLGAAYSGNDANEKSRLASYSTSTYFCPSMNNLVSDIEKTECEFSVFCEADKRMSVSLAPYIVKGLEDKGACLAYAHIAKGGVPISYYLEGGAEEYFYEKVRDFFFDCEARFEGDDMSERVLIWFQGESDSQNGEEYYLDALNTLWQRAKGAGFTKFFMIRVSFWADDGTCEVMRAQERFCEAHDDAYMLTRIASYLPWRTPDHKRDSHWLIEPLDESYGACRDSFLGYNNQHINENGFKIIAEAAVPNILRALCGEAPVLERERVRLCLEGRE